METKSFRAVTSIALGVALLVAILSLVGVVITGFYPGIVALVFVALIPLASKWYAKKINDQSTGFQRTCYTTLTSINVLAILVVLWMAFVIVHDRVLRDCC